MMEYILIDLTERHKELLKDKLYELAIAMTKYNRGVFGDKPEFTNTNLDFDSIGFVYYEGFQEEFDTKVLEEGSRLVLGNVLVHENNYEWKVAETDEGNFVFAVSHPDLKKPVILTPQSLSYNFNPRIDEGETYDFGDYFSEACEVLVYMSAGERRMYKHKPYGLKHFLSRQKN